MATREQTAMLFQHHENDSWSFLGDLDKARALLKSEGMTWWEGINPRTGNHWVEADMGRTPTGPGTGVSFGTGETLEQAWRYLIAAEIIGEFPETMEELAESLDENLLKDLLW